ncbi:MAG: hypothetical protein ACJAZP_002350 [Psychromonas sp.]|jgi:hypothetical protein|uniref:hypothetical protein n=1 Tax=Psychromonas sp. TaxID=1884585 RepID=UPI0039E5B403
MAFIKKWWQKYCAALDELGLTQENIRCCIPLDERAQKAIKEGEKELKPQHQDNKPL